MGKHWIEYMAIMLHRALEQSCTSNEQSVFVNWIKQLNNL